MSDRVPYLHVCVTCRGGQVLDEGAVAPGQLLFEAMAARAGPVAVKPVTCLASCERGCAAVISAPGKWGYLLGGLSAGLADDVLAYAQAYAGARTGTVMPSRRPASLARVVLGRVPPMETL